jgi:protoporphyrinogen oxidase
MRVGIIGGGLMGVALGYFLTETGHDVTILEQSNELGGLNGEHQFDDGLRVPRYQHAILPTDQAVIDLCAELGLKDDLIFHNIRTGFIHNRAIYPMSNILDFLAFPILGFRDRLRLGSMILKTRSKANWTALDETPAKEWLIETGGSDAFDRIWRPLLEAKFDWVYDNVAATYIWSWLHRMSSIRNTPQLEGSVGYLRRGHYSLIHALAEAFVKHGGSILYEVRVREIEVGGGQLQHIRTLSDTLEFDAVVAAIATPTFGRLIPGADTAYRASLEQAKYLGLICPVMALDRPLSPYWTLNVTDPNIPFATVIETPHPEHPEYHIVYLPRYTAPDNDWMGVSDQDIRQAWLEHVKQVFKDFDEKHIRYFAVSRSRYAEPVYSVHTLKNNVGVKTPYEGLYLANSAQVYPELPTSDATVLHARQVAQMVAQSQRAQVLT